MHGAMLYPHVLLCDGQRIAAWHAGGTLGSAWRSCSGCRQQPSRGGGAFGKGGLRSPSGGDRGLGRPTGFLHRKSSTHASNQQHHTAENVTGILPPETSSWTVHQC